VQLEWEAEFEGSAGDHEHRVLASLWMWLEIVDDLDEESEDPENEARLADNNSLASDATAHSADRDESDSGPNNEVVSLTTNSEINE
jgi:hypothetical protein